MDNSLNNLRTRFNNLQWGASAPESLPQPTPLPPMFVDMEKRFEQLILIQTNLLRILDNKKPLDINNNNRGILFEDGFNEFTKTMTKTLDSVTTASKEAYTNILKKSTSMNFPQQQAKQNPKPANPYMAMAYALSDSGVELGIDTTLGQALFKASVIQQKIGESKLKMENELKSKLNSQHLQEFNYLCDQAKILLKRVYNSQAKLNQIKNTISRTGRANDETAMSLALNQSQFDEGVAQCMATLQEIISRPETIEIVNLFVTNQKQFHQESYQILQDLQPQVQDLFHSQLGFSSPPAVSPLPTTEALPRETTPPVNEKAQDSKKNGDDDDQDVDFEEIL